MKDTEIIPNEEAQLTGDEKTVISRNTGRDQKTVRIDTPPPKKKKKQDEIIPTELLQGLYTITSKIGDGGMGIVYLAKDNKLGRNVAIKRLNESSMGHPSIKQRFFQEAKTVASLTHANIVHVYALDEDDSEPYIVMEYIPGPQDRSPDTQPPKPFSLVDLVHEDGPMSVPDALDMMLRICKAIAYAHKHGVIHRDLKPSNVLLDESYEPKIVDFGLARKSSAAVRKLTVPGEKMLSLGYGAPEQESDAGTSDERADIYGLGALTYFCITGQNPRYFRESDVPQELQGPISKALETNRDKRWSTVNEYIESLMRIQAPSQIEVPTIKTTWRCKWCDKINPIDLQFCEACGWDGITPCLECGEKMHVGVQYCRECGADAREYENADRLLSRLKNKIEANDFTYVVKHAERTTAFRPVGPNGRKMLEEILSLREGGEKAIERSTTLKEIIPMELSSENYERAKQFILEYRNLTDSYDYSSELQEIPDLIARRDILRARRALKSGEIKFAERLCNDIIKTNSTFSDDAYDIITGIKRRKFLKRMRNFVFILIGLSVVYVLSAAPVYNYTRNENSDEPFYSFYDAEMAVHNSTFLQKPLEAYARAWSVTNMYKERSIHKPIDIKPAAPIDNKLAGLLTSLRSQFDMEMLKIDVTYTRATQAWPDEYTKALESLQHKMQDKGDYDGWNSVGDEIYYLNVYGKANTKPYEEYKVEELDELRKSFSAKRDQYENSKNSSIIRVSTDYRNKLQEKLKQLTKRGDMDNAAAVKAEITRLNGEKEVTAAIAAMAAKEKKPKPSE